MYKTIRAFLSTILVLSLMIASSTTAFATESAHTEYPEGVPEYAEMHEVVIEIPADTDFSSRSVKTYNVDPVIARPNADTTITVVAATAKNISFEVKGEIVSGSVVANHKYSVNLIKLGVSILSVDIPPDGKFYKSNDAYLDNNTHKFVFKNNTSATIKVTLTYYLW
ncbi:MAG: hypothetical protein HFJ46_06190 [Clostridia bacterium]|nr:hypothetical protein [Clostridia bacterium]